MWEPLCFHGIGHLWIGDPGILRHPIGSCHRSVPPPSGRAQLSHQSAAVTHRGGRHLPLSADLLSLPFSSRTGLRTHPLCKTCVLCGSEEEERRRGEEEEGGFLWHCLVLEGRSQLLILRCTEKAPRAEVSHRLRNRNYCVLSADSQTRFYSAASSSVSVVSVRVFGGGGKCEYVAC